MRFGQRQCRAEHRSAPFDIEIAVIFDEAGKKVGFGQQKIDRHSHFERGAYFAEPAPHERRVPVETGAISAHQFVHAQRNDDPVDRRARAMLLHHRQKALPAFGIDRGIRILRGIPPRRIDQRSLVGEPEIEIARAADTFDRLVREWKAQARIEQCSGLACTRRADYDIPGPIVEIVAPPAGAAFQSRQRLGHAACHGGAFCVAGRWRGQFRLDRGRRLARAHHAQRAEQPPDTDYDQSQQQPHIQRRQPQHHQRQPNAKHQQQQRHDQAGQHPPVAENSLHDPSS